MYIFFRPIDKFRWVLETERFLVAFDCLAIIIIFLVIENLI